MIHKLFLPMALTAALLLGVARNYPASNTPARVPMPTLMTSAHPMSIAAAFSTPTAVMTPDPTVSHQALDELHSYRVRFVFWFEGTDEQGKSQAETILLLQEVINRSNDRHVRWELTGDGVGSNRGGAGMLDLYTVGGLSYLYASDSELKCASVSSDKGSLALVTNLNPTDLIGDLKKAQLVERGVMINDVMSAHYTFKQPDATPVISIPPRGMSGLLKLVITS